MAHGNMRKRARARRLRRRGYTLGDLVTSGSPKEIRTACKNIKCAAGRVCYCEAFVVPPDCWCGDVIVYPDGSTNASATSVLELASGQAPQPQTSAPKRARRRGRR